jgi:hypothetical protein
MKSPIRPLRTRFARWRLRSSSHPQRWAKRYGAATAVPWRIVWSHAPTTSPDVNGNVSAGLAPSAGRQPGQGGGHE